MFANPLGWFEVSNVPADYQKSVASLASVWRQERARLFAGRILPIGEAPDGQSWTGFASISQDGGPSYVLLFRELNRSTEWSLDMQLLPGSNHRVVVLAGKGEATMLDGRLMARISEPLQYLWLRVE